MPEQHDDHCVMNVDSQAWRVLEVSGHFMTVVSPGGKIRVADLNLLNWDIYCANAAEWLKEESARLARVAAHQAAQRADNARCVREAARREREHAEREMERGRREWQEAIRRSIGYAQLLASGYGPIDDLEREIVLVDLEDTDANEILAVDCQTFHLERLTP